jgi:hypothetical protein
MQVWIESASGRDEHGGEGWELGRCIWSPSHDRRGRVQKYGIMKSPCVGDIVINCSGGDIVGVSLVCKTAEKIIKGPPKPGNWDYAQSYFRIDLTDYSVFEQRVGLYEVANRFFDRLREDIEQNRPRYYLFSLYRPSEVHPLGKLVLSQGRFLARSTLVLTDCIAACLSDNDRDMLTLRINQRLTPRSQPTLGLTENKD